MDGPVPDYPQFFQQLFSFFYFCFVEDFFEPVKRVFCIMAYFFVCLFFCGGDDAVCYGCIGYASCFPFHGDGRYIAQS